MSDEFQVEEIIGKRTNNGRLEYKVKWEGFPLSDSTWEPLKNLKNVMDMVEEFESKHPEEKKEDKKDAADKKKKNNSNKHKLIGNKRKSPDSDEDKESENDEEEEIGSKDVKDKEEKPEKKAKNNSDSKEKEKETEDKIKYIKVVSINKDFKAEVLIEKNGAPSKMTLTTSQLKKINPEILIDFYESKIKFTAKHDK